MRTVVYRFRERATWGIYVSMRAEATLWDGEPSVGEHVRGPFWLDLGSVGLTPFSVAYLAEGMRLLEAPMTQKIDGRQVLISLAALDFSLSDFQDEGMTAVMLLWLAEEFDLERPIIKAHYDPGAGRYSFSWPAV
jgi:hypothetical protein